MTTRDSRAHDEEHAMGYDNETASKAKAATGAKGTSAKKASAATHPWQPCLCKPEDLAQPLHAVGGAVCSEMNRYR